MSFPLPVKLWTAVPACVPTQKAGKALVSLIGLKDDGLMGKGEVVAVDPGSL